MRRHSAFCWLCPISLARNRRSTTSLNSGAKVIRDTEQVLCRGVSLLWPKPTYSSQMLQFTGETVAMCCMRCMCCRRWSVVDWRFAASQLSPLCASAPRGQSSICRFQHPCAMAVVNALQIDKQSWFTMVSDLTQREQSVVFENGDEHQNESWLWSLETKGVLRTWSQQLGRGEGIQIHRIRFRQSGIWGGERWWKFEVEVK